MTGLDDIRKYSDACMVNVTATNADRPEGVVMVFPIPEAAQSLVLFYCNDDQHLVKFGTKLQHSPSLMDMVVVSLKSQHTLKLYKPHFYIYFQVQQSQVQSSDNRFLMFKKSVWNVGEFFVYRIVLHTAVWLGSLTPAN